MSIVIDADDDERVAALRELVDKGLVTEVHPGMFHFTERGWQVHAELCSDADCIAGHPGRALQ